jgi:hypothetical protein
MTRRKKIPQPGVHLDILSPHGVPACVLVVLFFGK